MKISRRLEIAEDEPFLKRLIVETADEELAAWSWPEPVRDHLLSIQYTSRRQSIHANFPEAQSQVILIEGESAGWLVVAELPGEIRLIEIMVAAGHRGKGIGSAVMREVLSEADHSGKPVRLTVGMTNSDAIRLYDRMGFRRIGGDAVRHEMERKGTI
jgi:ribosomal protein S18 acetylase RimI-like enzyme